MHSNKKGLAQLHALRWASAGVFFCVLAAPFLVVNLITALLASVASAPYQHALKRMVYWAQVARDEARGVPPRPFSPPQFCVGDAVRYMPPNANGDPTHRDCERGVVSSVSATGLVFVRFRGSTAQGVSPDQLQLVERART